MAHAATLLVRAGNAVVDAGDAAAVAAAIETANRAVRQPGLPDDLNPWLIDPARVRALLAALPPDAIATLGGNALYLNAEELPVHASSPTTPASFAALTGLDILDIQGGTALVRPRMPSDCALALAQAAKARLALKAVAGEIAALEARRATTQGDAETQRLNLLAAALARRFAIASAWHENAVAVSACSDDPATKADLAAAQQARSDFAVPGGPFHPP